MPIPMLRTKVGLTSPTSRPFARGWNEYEHSRSISRLRRDKTKDGISGVSCNCVYPSSPALDSHSIPLPGRAGPAHEGLWKDRGLRQTAGMDTINGEPRALLFAQHFATLPDPRQRLPQHPLLSILFIVLAAQLCGAEGWDAMVAFARAQQAWLVSFRALPKGVHSADTLRW